MQLNPNILNIQLLSSKTNSVHGLALPKNKIKSTDDSEVSRIASLLKTKVFESISTHLTESDDYSFKYTEEIERIDDSRVKIGNIEIKNDVLDFSCDVTLARYENGILSLSISPEKACSSFDYNIDSHTHNAAELNNIMEALLEKLFDYFEADLLFISDSTINHDLPENLGGLSDKIQHSQFIKLRSGALENKDADPEHGTFYNPNSQIFTGKLGNYPFSRNDASYYNQTNSNQAYYRSVTTAATKSQLKA